MKNNLVKTISVIIIAAFVWQQVSYAYPAGSLRPQAFAERVDRAGRKPFDRLSAANKALLAGAALFVILGVGIFNKYMGRGKESPAPHRGQVLVSETPAPGTATPPQAQPLPGQAPQAQLPPPDRAKAISELFYKLTPTDRAILLRNFVYPYLKNNVGGIGDEALLSYLVDMDEDKLIGIVTTRINKSAAYFNDSEEYQKLYKFKTPFFTRDILINAAQRNNVPVGLLVAIMLRETSDFIVYAGSPNDGRGLMQINVSTLELFWGRLVKRKIVTGEFNRDNAQKILLDPNLNVQIGAEVLGDALAAVRRNIPGITGDDLYKIALAIYNRGYLPTAKAIRLAKKDGVSPITFEALRKYYTDPRNSHKVNGKDVMWLTKEQADAMFDYINHIYGGLNDEQEYYPGFFDMLESVAPAEPIPAGPAGAMLDSMLLPSRAYAVSTGV